MRLLILWCLTELNDLLATVQLVNTVTGWIC